MLGRENMRHHQLCIRFTCVIKVPFFCLKKDFINETRLNFCNYFSAPCPIRERLNNVNSHAYMFSSTIYQTSNSGVQQRTFCDLRVFKKKISACCYMQLDFINRCHPLYINTSFTDYALSRQWSKVPRIRGYRQYIMTDQYLVISLV